MLAPVIINGGEHGRKPVTHFRDRLLILIKMAVVISGQTAPESTSFRIRKNSFMAGLLSSRKAGCKNSVERGGSRPPAIPGRTPRWVAARLRLMRSLIPRYGRGVSKQAIGDVRYAACYNLGGGDEGSR